MKMKDVFIGQIVINPKTEDWTDLHLPKVGKIVDIAYEYGINTIIANRGGLDRMVRVLPVVHFLDETRPRVIHPNNIEPYKG